MTSDDGYGADPPGTYAPTAVIGVQHDELRRFAARRLDCLATVRFCGYAVTRTGEMVGNERVGGGLSVDDENAVTWLHTGTEGYRQTSECGRNDCVAGA